MNIEAGLVGFGSGQNNTTQTTNWNREPDAAPDA